MARAMGLFRWLNVPEWGQEHREGWAGRGELGFPEDVGILLVLSKGSALCDTTGLGPQGI